MIFIEVIFTEVFPVTVAAAGLTAVTVVNEASWLMFSVTVLRHQTMF